MRFFEQKYPYILAILASGLWYWLALPFPKNEKEFLAASLSFGAIITGFMATAQAILMALPSDSVMAHLRTSGHIDLLIEYVAAAIYGSMIFCIANIVGFFMINEETKAILPIWYSTIWIFFVCFTVAAFYRVASITLKIMKH